MIEPMIYDQWEYLRSYRGLFPNLDAAIDYLLSHDVGSLPEGRHEIDGERIFLLVQSYRTHSPSVARYEVHQKYLDIQFLVEGEEHCFWSPVEALSPAEPFSPGRDIGFFISPSAPEVFFPLRPGRFIVFFPQDAHKPSCDAGAPRAVRKIVVKVALSSPE